MNANAPISTMSPASSEGSVYPMFARRCSPPARLGGEVAADRLVKRAAAGVPGFGSDPFELFDVERAAPVNVVREGEAAAYHRAHRDDLQLDRRRRGQRRDHAPGGAACELEAAA